MANYPDYDAVPGESRWYAASELVVDRVITIVGDAVMVFRQVERLPYPTVHERAEALRGLINALTEAQEPIEVVLEDGFYKAAEMERENDCWPSEHGNLG